MGRRYKGVPPEMVDDKGIPGKLYFEEPQVVNITVVRSGTNVSTIDLSATAGPCRLASTVQMRDFNRNSDIQYRCGLKPTLKEIQEYIKWAEIQGFGLGAIVARRWCADWRYETPFEWGAIMGCKTYMVSALESGTWSPFTVRWFNRNMNEEGAWCEDLYVIHQTLSKDLLASIIEDQQPEVINNE